MFGVSVRRLSAGVVVVALALLFVPTVDARGLEGARPAGQPSASWLDAAWGWVQSYLAVGNHPAGAVHSLTVKDGTGTGTNRGGKIPETGACIDPQGNCKGL